MSLSHLNRFAAEALLLLTLIGASAWGVSGAPVTPPEMVAIPAGEFLMGSEEGASWEKPAHRVEVSAFWIGKRPVTNGEFRVFRPDHRSPVDDSNHAPVRAVSWEDAVLYCQWLSEQTGIVHRLPTEAEWERAIRGGLEQKQYPWGDEPAVPEEAVSNRSAWPPPPPNAFGLLIEYELWEWTADIYGRDYYEHSPVQNPPGPAEGEFRVLRGGSYPNDPNSMRCSNRGSARPRTVLPSVTFRIARDENPVVFSESRQPTSPGGASQGQPVSVTQTQPALAAQSARSTPRRPATSTPPAPVAETEPPVSEPEAPAKTESMEAEESAPPTPPARDAGAVDRPASTSAPAENRAVASGSPAQLTRIDVTTSAEQIILVLSLSASAEYSTMELNSPDRVVIDVANTAIATSQKYGSTDVGALGIEQVRWAPFRPDAESPTARVVIDLSQPASYTVESTATGLVVRLRPR